MKKHLIAAGIWMALFPGAVSAMEEESVAIRVDLNNVDAIGALFEGGAISELPLAVPAAVELFSESVESIQKPAGLSTPSTAKRDESPLEVETTTAITTTSPELLLEDLDEANDEVSLLAENFQRFTMPTAAIDYQARANYWAERAAKAGEVYTYQVRVGNPILNRFQQRFNEQFKSSASDSSLLVDQKGLTPKGEELYQILLASEEEGLLPQLYHVGRIQNLLQSDPKAHRAEINQLLQEGMLAYIRDMVVGMPELKKRDPDWLLEGRKVDPAEQLVTIIASDNPEVEVAKLQPNYPEYRNLKRALRAFKAKEFEQEPPLIAKGPTIKPGMSGERVIQMRDRLNYQGYDAGDANYYDAKMGQAVKAFQKTHLLEPDGAAGTKTITELNRSNRDRIEQIQINMERWRWMPETMGNHYVAVDIPGFRYSVMKEGREVLNARTVVGRGARKTPVFMSPMSYIVFSPYWHVPRSMAVNDFLPRLKQNPYALNRSKIRIFRNGVEIDPGSVDWSQYSRNNFPFQLRQDPGDHNSLGRVKFMFPNEHAIYLHDTPSKYLFDRTSRDFSSGCVRIENPEELAEYFLGEAGWDQKRIKAAFKRSSEAHVNLDRDKKIPVYTLYMTTRVENDSISFRADIYSKDKVLLESLSNLSK
ncbi:L,D-transpeptidase family protein [Ignatzschineria cameli]|uniref:Murein L,D-transpeptidase n=1 Tax=Ignatzschineria cameli TaxID=2182793 RepID=A0A2U2AL44_9GAMM|nr:L,D-transpeptidase family protein [Ignatzschineria cameli]PWD83931.1 murein L,D-transpeptidase [Ignatzschineria cameli]